MTDEQKQKLANLEDVQAFVQVCFNQGIGNMATCSTAAATQDKAVTLGTTFELVADALLLITFTNAITAANPRLVVTHTTIAGTTTTEAAKPIYYRGAALGSGLVKAGQQVLLKYNGTQFEVVGDLTPSGFLITHNNTTGADQFEAIGSATVTHNSSTGADVFTY